MTHRNIKNFLSNLIFSFLAFSFLAFFKNVHKLDALELVSSTEDGTDSVALLDDDEGISTGVDGLSISGSWMRDEKSLSFESSMHVDLERSETLLECMRLMRSSIWASSSLWRA